MTLLNSKRLTLSSQLTENDLGQVVGWLNDPEVVRYSEQRHRKHNIDDQYKYLMAFDPRDFYLGIHKEWKIIGTISATIDRPNGVANVGMMIGERQLWGRGYGLEAWSCLCDYLFKHNVRKIEAGCMSINAGMMKVCRRYGMAEEGRRKDHFLLGEDADGNNIGCDLVSWGRFYESGAKLFKRRRRPLASKKSISRGKSCGTRPTDGVAKTELGTGDRVREREVSG